MSYLAVFIVGFILAVFILNYESIKRSWIKNRERKRFLKLCTGTPTKTVKVFSWYGCFKYRKYPFLIDDKVCVPVNVCGYWHVNDMYKRFNDLNGNHVGYLKTNLLKSRECSSGFIYYESLNLSEKCNETGKRVKVFVIVESKRDSFITVIVNKLTGFAWSVKQAILECI